MHCFRMRGDRHEPAAVGCEAEPGRAVRVGILELGQGPATGGVEEMNHGR